MLAALSAGAAVTAGALAKPINTGRDGVAIHGYDALSYFDEGRPAKGSPSFTHEWMGAEWWFASAERRDRFAAGPERFAPRYGGYCAWAVSKGYTANGDPRVWKIVDGKLYLNYNASVKSAWEKEQTARIQDADAKWPSLHAEVAR